jgi:hypothetical protein
MAEQMPEYDDLKVEFARGAGGSYTVTAESSDGRKVRGLFTPPLTDDELDELVRDVGLVRRSRRSQQGRLDELEEFGSGLFAALVREQVADVYHSARAAAQDRKRGLRITLNLSGAPELMRLPWEFLYRRPRFLSQSMSTPVVRTLDLESARRPQELQLPLRILGMVSSPSGYANLDADEERRKLEEALSPLRDDGLVELEWLERATLEEFGRRIAEPDQIHVLHYIGHGAYDESTESGILVLETRQGRAQDVSGRTLGSMLQDEESLRLVVLNSCEGARTSRIDPFSGVAGRLLEFDIPAVVGMQFEITDEAAIAFSQALYAQLAQGLPVDGALGPARRAIVAAGMEAEFGTPVLFLRASDARLFEPRRGDPPASVPYQSPPSSRPGLPTLTNDSPPSGKKPAFTVDTIETTARTRTFRITRGNDEHTLKIERGRWNDSLYLDGVRVARDGSPFTVFEFPFDDGEHRLWARLVRSASTARRLAEREAMVYSCTAYRGRIGEVTLELDGVEYTL